MFSSGHSHTSWESDFASEFLSLMLLENTLGQKELQIQESPAFCVHCKSISSNSPQVFKGYWLEGQLMGLPTKVPSIQLHRLYGLLASLGRVRPRVPQSGLSLAMGPQAVLTQPRGRKAPTL